jgi:pimeloyl-ACP methyl ester carboxylesterase
MTPPGAYVDIGRLVDLPMGRLQIREDGTDNGLLPLLLIHGFAGSLRVWDPMIAELSRHRRVLRVDLLGHGGSDKPSSGYAIPAQAEAVYAVLDHLGIDRVLAVAHSGGGDVVVAMMESQPARVAGVVLLGTAPDVSFVHLAFAARLVAVPLLGRLLWSVMTDGMIRDGLARTFAPSFPSVPDRFVSDVRRMTHRSHVQGRAELERYKRRRDLPSRIAHARVPLLAVFGDRDQWVDPRAADRWSKIPGAQIEILRGVGHTPMAEAPGPIAEIIVVFARRVDP